METRDAVVVGAGHNGLACAALLARAGLDVLALERRGVPGGAAATEELVSGYRFSTCAYAVHLLDRRVLAGDRGGRAAAAAAAAAPRRRGRERAARAGAPGVGRGRSGAGALALGPPPGPDGIRAEARRRGVEQLVERFARSSLRGLGALDELAPPYFEADPDEPGGPLAYACTKRPRLGPGVPEGWMGTVAAAFACAAGAAGRRLGSALRSRRSGSRTVRRVRSRSRAGGSRPARSSRASLLRSRLAWPVGPIHHLPHDPAHMGAARPGPRTALRRLYLCGAGTHPGGEISGAPGVNAARVVLADLEIAGAEALV